MSGGASSAQRSHAQHARRVALEVILAFRESDAYANLLLPARIARAELPAADAALATELTYGTLRMQGYYDRVIARAAGRPGDRIDAPILDVLRLGAHQLLSTRVAPHAAVNESVALARQAGSRSATGFVNGVLREIGRHAPAEWRRLVLAGAKNEDDRLAASTSHPVWIVLTLRRALEAEGRGDELEALLDADNVAPRVNLVVLPGLADAPEDARPDRFSPPGFTTRRRSAAARGRDRGPRPRAGRGLPARRARPHPLEPDRTGGALARPLRRAGGKAALLAAEALAGGATLVANELVPARAELVRRALAAVPLDVPVWQRDGLTIGETEPAAFDRILLDAPAPVSAPFAAAPKRAGGRPRAVWPSWRTCRRVSSIRRWPRSNRAGRWLMSPARRTSPRPAVSSRTRCAATRGRCGRCARRKRCKLSLASRSTSPGTPPSCSCGRTGS